MRALIVLAAAFALAAPAAAAGPSLRVQPALVHPGGVVTLTGAGWSPRAKVVLAVGPPRSEADPVATARTDARGSFRKSIRLRPEATPGAYVVLACQRSCRTKAAAPLRIG